MDIILFENGRGIINADAVMLDHGRLPLRFIGAPAYSTLQIISDNQIVRRTLSSKGETTLDISEVTGRIKFKVISTERIWQCDGPYIERDSGGNCIVMPLAEYTKLITDMYDELRTMRSDITSLKAAVGALTESKTYKFV